MVPNPVILSTPSENCPECAFEKAPAVTPIPSGWRRARSEELIATPRGSLSNTIGSFISAGDRHAVLIEWHCHCPGSGATPVGWHKGATILTHDWHWWYFDAWQYIEPFGWALSGSRGPEWLSRDEANTILRDMSKGLAAIVARGFRHDSRMGWEQA